MQPFLICKKSAAILAAVLLVCIIALSVRAEGTTISLVIPENNEVEKNYPVDLDTLPEAERQQIEAAVNNAIDSVKEELTALSSFNGSPTSAPDSAVTSVLGEGGYVDVQLTSVDVTVQKNTAGADTAVITGYIFDVTPYKIVNNTATAQYTLSRDVPFRLPVVVDGYKYANTALNGKYIGQYNTQGTFPNKYIEIFSKNFGLYGCVLTNTKAEENGSSGNDPSGSVSETVYYSMTAIAHGGGTINFKGVIGVEEFADMYYQISPNKGEKILRVLVDGVDVGAVSNYTFKHITKNHVIEVFFSGSGSTTTDRTNPQTGIYS